MGINVGRNLGVRGEAFELMELIVSVVGMGEDESFVVPQSL